jgi:hypothetical protein
MDWAAIIHEIGPHLPLVVLCVLVVGFGWLLYHAGRALSHAGKMIADAIKESGKTHTEKVEVIQAEVKEIKTALQAGAYCWAVREPYQPIPNRQPWPQMKGGKP